MWEEFFSAAAKHLGTVGVVALATLGVFIFITLKYMKSINGFSTHLSQQGRAMQEHREAFQQLLQFGSTQTETLRILGDDLRMLSKSIQDSERTRTQELLTLFQVLRGGKES